MIKPTCSRCGNELSDFGAILFGPPDRNARAKKMHLCKGCYREVLRLIKTD
jgi:hypothetical protein